MSTACGWGKALAAAAEEDFDRLNPAFAEGLHAPRGALGVGTWAFSALKFQADMGVLLAFMFLFNMLGATLVMPALARRLFHGHIEERKLRKTAASTP